MYPLPREAKLACLASNHKILKAKQAQGTESVHSNHNTAVTVTKPLVRQPHRVEHTQHAFPVVYIHVTTR